jgi:hypothetical protein
MVLCLRYRRLRRSSSATHSIGVWQSNLEEIRARSKTMMMMEANAGSPLLILMQRYDVADKGFFPSASCYGGLARSI